MNFWQTIEKPIAGMSPMDGITDASFRFIVAKHGDPDVIFTEFVSVESAFHAPHSLINDLAYSEIERPVIAQIYGHTPELFYKVAHVVCELGFDGLDINMGCPAKKVAAKGSGAALILTPELAKSIMRSAARGVRDWSEGQTLADLDLAPELIRQVEAANRSRSARARRPIPLSVKTRLGYDKVVVEDWIQTLLEESPAAISLHGRTLAQMYKGSADWEAIARAAALARNSGTLILGNGDLQTMEDAYRRVRETGVDGVLFGRGAQGDPWMFRAKNLLKEAARANDIGRLRSAPVGMEERFAVMLEHSRHFMSRRGAPAFVAMRKHLAWYCRGLRGAAALRSRLVRANTVADVVACLDAHIESIAAANGLLLDEHANETRARLSPSA